MSLVSTMGERVARQEVGEQLPANREKRLILHKHTNCAMLNPSLIWPHCAEFLEVLALSSPTMAIRRIMTKLSKPVSRTMRTFSEQRQHCTTFAAICNIICCQIPLQHPGDHERGAEPARPHIRWHQRSRRKQFPQEAMENSCMEVMRKDVTSHV